MFISKLSLVLGNICTDTDEVYIVSAHLIKVLYSCPKLYCTFIEFRKAYEYVVRDNLWYKLI